MIASASSGDRNGLMSSTPNVCLTYCGGLVGWGCVGQLASPSISLFGTGRSSIGQIGCAGHAIEDVQPPGLVGDDDDVAVPSLVTDGRELRRRAGIQIPEVVVHELEMPPALAAARVERDDGRAEEIGAVPIRAVEVIRRRSERDEDDAAANVDRRLTPVVDPADVFPGVFRPRVVAELAGARHRVERPDEFAGENVVGADVARRRHVVFPRRAPQDDQILEDASGRVRLDRSDRLRIAAIDPDAQVDDPVRAERHDRLSRLRVHLLQQAVHREDQPLVAPVRCFPSS